MTMMMVIGNPPSVPVEALVLPVMKAGPCAVSGFGTSNQHVGLSLIMSLLSLFYRKTASASPPEVHVGQVPGGGLQLLAIFTRPVTLRGR